MKKIKVILSGGGTGGHIYPAVSVAQSLERILGNNVEILFVGAEGKMEMEKVPALGYRIEGVPVAGLQRRLTLSNLKLPFKVCASVMRCFNIISDFKPDIVLGFGGYASAPILFAAQMKGVPTIIQEQNSYPGITNKFLARRAKRICVAYDGMERFFDASKIVLTGNPLRSSFLDSIAMSSDSDFRKTAVEYFGLDPQLPIVLIVGGSLGTRTLNESVLRHLDSILEKGDVQLIWQTGKFYKNELDEILKEKELKGIWRGEFIDRMDYAYAASDLVISRSGACTISELELLGKPTIFVPSPNVAEDHQTKNAKALSSVGAAILVTDSQAREIVIPMARQVVNDEAELESISRKIIALGIADSADRVVNEVLKLLKI